MILEGVGRVLGCSSLPLRVGGIPASSVDRVQAALYYDITMTEYETTSLAQQGEALRVLIERTVPRPA